MDESEFRARFERITASRDRGEIGMLDVGRLYRELCEEWRRDHADLPAGFVG